MVVKEKGLVQLAGTFVALAANLEKKYLNETKKELRLLINNTALNEVVYQEAMVRLINELAPDDAQAWVDRYVALVSELATETVNASVDLVDLVHKNTKAI